jgi:signal transduction histidine kinase/CheY-like chemotaxis protein
MTIFSSNNYHQKVYRVLIVEDCRADFELYQKFLAKDDLYQYTIDHAGTGKEGLELLVTHTYNLVLIDFSLSDMDGLQMIEAIRKIQYLTKVPIVMLTGHGNEQIALEAMKKHIQDYWIKDDLNWENFMDRIHEAIESVPGDYVDLEAKKIEILIVDDSEADLEVYKRFLEKDSDCHFQVYQATTGEEAFDFLANQTVDVILIDYSLPDINGVDLIKHLPKLNLAYPLTPSTEGDYPAIVMMTGQGNEQVVVDAMKSGASDYLMKQSITPESLRKSLKNVLEKSRLAWHIRKIELQKELIAKISLSIRNSLDLNDILQTSVTEVKKYLQCDRALIYQLDPEKAGQVVAESVDDPFTKTLGLRITDTFFESKKNRDDYIVNCRRQLVNNIAESNLDPCHIQLLEKFQVKSVMALPIVIENLPNPLWGLLIVHFCHEPHFWTRDEVLLLDEISFQVAIGIQQGLLVAELKKERDRANQATEVKSVFLANMSHEIRTPMNGILGMAEILSLSDLSQQQQDYVNIIQASGNSLLSLINDILDLSKLEAEKIQLKDEEFILADIVGEVVKLFSVKRKEKDVQINLAIAPNLPKQYLGDPDRLKQILMNLIGNAVKFTERGSVTITIENYQAAAELPANEIELYFAIQDTGIGILLEDQNKLFQPFSQVNDSSTRKFEGTGLGLSICKKLVGLMGGKIGVTSEINQGSTFWFTAKLKCIALEVLSPLGQKDLTQSTQDNQNQQISELRETLATILVVEDNRINQKLIKNQLKQLGYNCDIAENGAVALEKLQENSYPLILMDCQMPVLNGYDTTREIRQNETTQATQDMIIIGLTAFSMKDDRQKCLDAGMNDYLSKPCKLSQLQAMLEQWI